MSFKSALSDDLYDLWMCRNEHCGAVCAIEISEENASTPLQAQKLEDHGLECQVCDSKGMEKIVPDVDR